MSDFFTNQVIEPGTTMCNCGLYIVDRAPTALKADFAKRQRKNRFHLFLSILSGV
jgi:hypothetical protein